MVLSSGLVYSTLVFNLAPIQKYEISSPHLYPKRYPFIRVPVTLARKRRSHDGTKTPLTTLPCSHFTVLENARRVLPAP
jgi:hypothetical protein